MAGTLLRIVPAKGCDCNVCPFYTGNPAATEPVCSGSNSDCSYCGCARAEAANPAPTACGQCSIRCGSRVDIGAWMADIGGTVTFDDIDLGTRPLPEQLPRYTPQVDTKELIDLDAGLHWGAYAVGLRRVMSPSTGDLLPGYATATSARDALGLQPDQLAVLVGYGTDPHVEMFWTRRHDLIDKLAEMRWDVVLAPNYSIYGNYPRAEMLINMRRNLLITQEMRHAGINAIPNLYWFRLEDLRRYQSWALDTEPPAVAINIQTFRTDTDWDGYALPGLTYLAGHLPRNTRIICTGASRAARIAELLELFGNRLHLIGQNALAYARRGAVMTTGGRDDVGAHTPDAFAANVRYYDGLMEGTAL
jgi:hypothetical protein